MSNSFLSLQKFGRLMAPVALVALSSSLSWGQVTAPSTYTTAIQVQGEALGTEFDDWASSGIPIASTDPADNVGFIDIKEIQIANDANNIYIRVGYHDNNSVGTFLAFDTDQNVATGFDVFTLGLVGSELGYSNDFAFEQDSGAVFNTGDPLTGGPIGNGGALIFPFYNIEGPQKEYAISLDIAFTNPAEAVFTGQSFDLLVYTDQGLADVSEVISYTLASPPAGQPGDFDGDLDVDGNDFLIWQRGNSTNGSLNPGDLSDWQNNYAPSPLTANVSAVPEPSTVLMTCLGLTACGLRRRRA